MPTDAVNLLFLAAVALAVAAFDLWRWLGSGRDTISSTLYRIGRRWPWLPWLALAGLGYLWLHLFWGW